MTDSLASLTAQSLQQLGIAFAQEADGALRIAGPNAAIGDIVVAFDDGEISVFLGDITYCHFMPAEAHGKFPACTPEQAVAEAVQYLAGILSDEWVIWRWPDGRGGCYQPGGDDWEAGDSPLPGEAVQYYHWSGAVVRPDQRIAPDAQ